MKSDKAYALMHEQDGDNRILQLPDLTSKTINGQYVPVARTKGGILCFGQLSGYQGRALDVAPQIISGIIDPSSVKYIAMLYEEPTKNPFRLKDEDLFDTYIDSKGRVVMRIRNTLGKLVDELLTTSQLHNNRDNFPIERSVFDKIDKTPKNSGLFQKIKEYPNKEYPKPLGTDREI